MSKPIWTIDEDGDYVAVLHGTVMVVTIGTQGDFYSNLFYGKDYWSDDTSEFFVGTFRSLPEAMSASEDQVLEWYREELAGDLVGPDMEDEAALAVDSDG